MALTKPPPHAKKCPCQPAKEKSLINHKVSAMSAEMVGDGARGKLRKAQGSHRHWDISIRGRLVVYKEGETFRGYPSFEVGGTNLWTRRSIVSPSTV